jgi:superfamily II RNA helicase
MKTEKKSKHLGQELECQKHNSEAVIKGHEERLKEKEKKYRYGYLMNSTYRLLTECEVRIRIYWLNRRPFAFAKYCCVL